MLESCMGGKWTLHLLSQIRRGVVPPGQLERTADGLATKVMPRRVA